LDPVRKKRLKERQGEVPFHQRNKEAPLSAAETAYIDQEITSKTLFESFLAVAEDGVVTNEGMQRWVVSCYMDGWLTEADVRTAFLQVCNICSR